MAGGAVVQVVAVGQQDIYLTSSPMITFFKAIYKRHTNFAVESIEQTFNGTPSFGGKATATISRSGDLIHKIYLKVDLPALVVAAGVGSTGRWVNYVGQALVDYVTLSIGGTQIDKHYGEWLHIWNELSLPESRHSKYIELIGQRASTLQTATAAGNTKAGQTIYVPLEFWFNRNPGLALPLIAMAYHEVKLEFSFRSVSDLTVTAVDGFSTTPVLGSTTLYVDYVFLDAEERKNFAQSPHEYLIEQLQFTGTESASGSAYKSRLSFNHPTKEIVWAIRPSSSVTEKVIQFTPDTVADTFVSAKLQLNGNDRASERDAMTYNMINPLACHTRAPAKGIYVYSFALKPEEHQPSGTLNFSRIDNATLHLTTPTAGSLFVFAFNYNVMRVLSGMAGLAYNS
jgi:hypothetical protein